MSQFVRITADPLIDDEFSAGYTGSLNTYIGSIGFAGSQGAYTLQLNIDPTGFGGSIGYLGSNLSDVGILAGFVDENGFIGSVGWINPIFPSITLIAETLPGSPVAGQIVFDGTHFQGYNGTAWKQIDN